MVGMEEYLDVRDLWRAGKSISEIARLTGRDRKTVRRLVREKAPGPRAPRGVSSKLDPFRDYLLLQRLLQDKVSNAAVLFDEIRERGYTGGRSILWEFLHPLRSLLEDRATVRFETPPGKQAQVDWGSFRKARMETGAGVRAHAGLVAGQLSRFQRDPGSAGLPGLPRTCLPSPSRSSWRRSRRR